MKAKIDPGQERLMTLEKEVFLVDRLIDPSKGLNLTGKTLVSAPSLDGLCRSLKTAGGVVLAIQRLGPYIRESSSSGSPGMFYRIELVGPASHRPLCVVAPGRSALEALEPVLDLLTDSSLRITSAEPIDIQGRPMIAY